MQPHNVGTLPSLAAACVAAACFVAASTLTLSRPLSCSRVVSGRRLRGLCMPIATVGRVVGDWVGSTQQMEPDLVCATREGLTQHERRVRCRIVAERAQVRLRRLAVDVAIARRRAVGARHTDRLAQRQRGAHGHASAHAREVLLAHAPALECGRQLVRCRRRARQQQRARHLPVEAVQHVQPAAPTAAAAAAELQVWPLVLQDLYHCVAPEPPRVVDWHARRLVQHEEVILLEQQLDRRRGHAGFSPHDLVDELVAVAE
eukprot:6093736-Prymnesium_polylepis.1